MFVFDLFWNEVFLPSSPETLKYSELVVAVCSRLNKKKR